MPTSLVARTGPINYVSGLLVNSNNYVIDQQDEINRVGEAVCAILGVVDCNSAYNPVTISASGLTITVGGNGTDGSPQLLITQGRVCDYIPATPFSTPTATGAVATRIDLLAVKFLSQSISGIVPGQIVKNNLGINNVQPVGLNYSGVGWSYVVGTPGGGVPATPGGYEAFATITMAAGASSVSAGQITYLFPSVTQSITGSELQKFGVQTGVPADGTAESTVTLSTAYPVALDIALATPNLNGSTGSNALSCSVDTSFGNTMFKIYVAGGPIGSTVNVNWMTLGH